MSLAVLTIDINARLANLERDLGKVAHLSEQSANRMSSAFKSMNAAFASLAGIGAGALFTGLIKSSIDLQDQLGSLSKKTGISARDLSGLKFAADQNGASLELISKAVKELSISMSATPDKFAKLGINATSASGALAQISDLVSTMPDGMQKTALLAELMGSKVGPEMAEFMSIGGAAMRDHIERGKDIYKITDENAAKAKEFKDQMAELEAHVSGFGVTVANQLLPSLTQISKAMADAAREGGLLKALFIGFGGIATGVFTDGLLEREQKIAKDLAKLREEQAALVHRREVIPSWLNSAQGNDSKINANNEQMLKLERELLGIQTRRAELNKSSTESGGVGLPYQWQKPVEDELERFKKYKTAREAASKTFLGQSDELSFIEEEQRFKNHMKRIEDLQKPMQRGESLVSGLSIDFNNDIEKKLRDLNSPLMSGVDRQHADNLAAVAEKSARVKESLDALNLTEKDRATLTGEINALTAVQADRMEALRKQIEANNSSWQHGAQVALRNYLDEVSNVAKQSEALFTNAFKGMEDALVQFATKGKLDFSSLANSIVADMARIAIQQSITGPLMGMMMGAFNSPNMGPGSNYSWGAAGGGGAPNLNAPVIRNANGNVFGFANGGAFTNGIFNQTTPFRFAGGGGFNLGIMGEAGPEAVMPLSRGSDGKLGVRAQGGGGLNISYAPTIQIDSRTDQAQVHQLVSNAVKRGNAELVDTLQRRGVI